MSATPLPTEPRIGEPCRILLTGASGYVGGRLLRALEAHGERVRCLARHPGYLAQRVAPVTEVVAGNVLNAESLTDAFREVDVAYYLVHSMGSTGDFEQEDRRGAENFAAAAAAVGARRIIYLGGLGSGKDLSPHLRSRQEVGRILRESGVPTIEFRASIVIGSGSLSFEMVRTLVNRLPVMITPRWVRTAAQPIAIEDLIQYLVAALEVSLDNSEVLEIGGADQVSYGGIMREYARQRGLKRLMIPVPLLSPWLSARWLGLVTPLYARVGRKMLDSVRNSTVVQDERVLDLFPIRPRGIADAVERALKSEDTVIAETRWSDALSSKGASRSWAGTRFLSRIVDSRTVRVPSPQAAAFAPIRRIGGTAGWYYSDWLWQLRGFLDLLVGGAGTRRGRRDPDHVLPGDTIDFWRVEAVEPDQRLRLQAEMKLPGRAWLEFEVTPDGDGSVIRQTAVFDPVGLLGLAYWYALYPIHRFVFRGMLDGIARAAVRKSSLSPQSPGAGATSSDSRAEARALDHTKP
jgi:uncharacterized protein YbjT (DUF2867 family)